MAMLCYLSEEITWGMFVSVNFRAVALVGWLDDLQFYFLFNSISVITGQWTNDNERLCAMKLCLWFGRFHLKRDYASPKFSGDVMSPSR